MLEGTPLNMPQLFRSSKNDTVRQTHRRQTRFPSRLGRGLLLRRGRPCSVSLKGRLLLYYHTAQCLRGMRGMHVLHCTCTGHPECVKGPTSFAGKSSGGLHTTPWQHDPFCSSVCATPVLVRTRRPVPRGATVSSKLRNAAIAQHSMRAQ